MKRRTNYVYENVGEMYLRQRKIDELIKKTETKIQEAPTPEETTFNIGKLSAIVDYRSSKHKKIIEAVIETKKSLENHQYYDSILDEIEFVGGYVKGLNILLELDKELFDISPNFVLFIYATTEELKSKYDLSLSLNEKLDEFGSAGSVRYYVSTSVDDICDKIMHLGSETLNAVCAVYQEEHLPTKEIMQQLAFEKSDNIFLLCDKEEIKVSNIIRKIFRTTSV